MRKIGSDEKEKKKKRNMLLISLFMLATLVFGTVGYGFLAGPGTIQDTDDNEIPEGEVINFGNYWALNFQGTILRFSHSPEETKNIEINSLATLQTFSGSQLYVDADNQAVLQEIFSTLGVYTRIQEGCLDSCPDRDVPEKTCKDNIIVWKDNTEQKVTQEENCIFIEGDLKSVDAFLYKLFNVN